MLQVEIFLRTFQFLIRVLIFPQKLPHFNQKTCHTSIPIRPNTIRSLKIRNNDN